MIALEDGQLKGSFPPLVTPFLEDGRVDHATFERLVDFQARGGSHGIIVTGTTGNPSILTLDERIELYRRAVDVADGRLQVVAATGAQSHAETLRLCAAAEQAGTDGLLVVTPYFLRPPPRGLVAYFNDVFARTALPAMIYHIPGRAAVDMSAATIAEIAAASPNLVGIKHASLDLALVTDLLIRLGHQFRIHVGLEEMSFPMLAVGAHGMMNAVGNLAPDRVAALYEAAVRGDMARARRLHFELHELNRAVFYDINPIPMKYMMLRLGLLPAETHRLPLVPSTPELRARLDPLIEALRLPQAA